jgi:c-di-AMP phosphodiesterase-like protein
MVLGIIMLDNYNDIAGNAEDDNNDVVSKVAGPSLNTPKIMASCLRRFRSDSYFAVCNYEALEKMENDQFSLLAKVRGLAKGSDTIPTLSIGFAHNFPDVNKLNEMASNAIDIAMSRGGDQAVVSKYGEELKFFGGKTEAVETTAKVKVRSIADSLASIIKEATNVLIMGHTEMDMDALGACLGSKRSASGSKRRNPPRSFTIRKRPKRRPVMPSRARSIKPNSTGWSSRRKTPKTR